MPNYELIYIGWFRGIISTGCILIGPPGSHRQKAEMPIFVSFSYIFRPNQPDLNRIGRGIVVDLKNGGVLKSCMSICN